MFTLSSDIINRQFNTQLYNTVLSNCAQISTWRSEIALIALEIVLRSRGGSFFELLRASLAGLLAESPVVRLAGGRVCSDPVRRVLVDGAGVWSWVVRLVSIFLAPPPCGEEISSGSSMLGFNEESITLHPLKTKIEAFAGSKAMLM